MSDGCTGFAFRFEHRKWNRGRNGLHQLGQPVATQGINNFRVRTKTPKETKYTAILYDAWRFQKCDFQQNPMTSKFYSKMSYL